MAMYFNGTLIPEDVANALTVNGNDVTAVWANGVQVWAQQLFAAQWSNDSIAVMTSPFSVEKGFIVSGSLLKYQHIAGNLGTAWIQTYTDGTFSGSSRVDVSGSIYGIDAGGSGYSSLPNGMLYFVPSVTGPQILFTIATGWSGNSYTNTDYGLQTSGNLMRFLYTYLGTTYYGAWSSLT